MLDYSRMLGVRFATDKTRPTTLRSIVRCVDDLGGASAKFLTDRDTVSFRTRGGMPRSASKRRWVDDFVFVGRVNCRQPVTSH